MRSGGASMKHRDSISVLSHVLAGLWSSRGRVIAVIAALLLLPIEITDAGWLSDLFASPSKHAKSSKHHKPTKHVASSKPQTTKLAALVPNGAIPSALKSAETCEPSKFRVVLDVGHTAESEGAISARNVAEFVFNLRLAKRIEEKLKDEGFAETRLLVTEGKARPSLFRRVSVANNLHANLFLSIHHDSVPDKFLEDWQFEGKKSYFSDRFSGYSVFVSSKNPHYETSLLFANLVAKQMKAQGLQYAEQYSQPIMGHYQHPLLNKETGVYSYDQLIVLKSALSPAVLLEAGSISNRDEELKMNSPERQDMVTSSVSAAVKEFCALRSAQAAR
jgi:N-acetylmuramoyl-L-alanine amidase